MQNLVHVLVRDDVGARALEIVALSRRRRGQDDRSRLDPADAQRPPCGAHDRIKLEALAATQDAGFGFEAVGLAVTRAETDARAADGARCRPSLRMTTAPSVMRP